MARRLLTKATYRLRRKGFYAGTLSLGVKTTDGQKLRRELTLKTPAQDPFSFMRHLDTLWDEIMMEFGMLESWNVGTPSNIPTFKNSNIRFKHISTLLLNLRTKEEITGDILDEHLTDNMTKIRKNEALTTALDALQTKYKAETVTLGTPPKTLSGYVGTKIAFSRVPDNHEFWT